MRSVALGTTNGSVTLGLPSNAKIGRVQRVDTTHGRITSDWPLNVDRSNYVGSSVDQTLQPGGTAINVSTQNGSISLRKN